LANNHARFNTALINTAENPEETIDTPRSSPRVGNNPILSGVTGDTPADNLHSVTAQKRTRGVLVDTRLVVHEVLVDRETSLNGTIGLDGGLDGGNIRQGDNVLGFVAGRGGAILAGEG